MRLLPWAPKTERRTRIRTAERAAEEAQKKAEAAKKRVVEVKKKAASEKSIDRDIRTMIEDNHFFAAIQEAILGKDSEN